MSTVKNQTPQFHVGDWVAFAFGPKKVEAKVVEDRGPIGVRGRRLYRVQLEEGQELEEPLTFEVSENELQPTSIPVRQSFHVSYTRKGKTNVWRATTKSNGVRRGVKAKGAVGYSTAMWEGETADDQRHATVAVLLEVDPRFGNSDHGDPVEEIPGIIGEAQELADEMFLSRHPRARVEHVG